MLDSGKRYTIKGEGLHFDVVKSYSRENLNSGRTTIDSKTKNPCAFMKIIL